MYRLSLQLALWTLRFYFGRYVVLLTCSIIIVVPLLYHDSMGQIIKSVDVCLCIGVCVCVCAVYVVQLWRAVQR